MRNWHAQALAPGMVLGITIEPPIAEHEKHYLFTGLGPGSVVVRLIDNGRIAISNPTRFVAPFVFFVGPKQFLPPTIQQIAKLLANL